MYFTSVGCPSSNVGNVSGTKAGTALSGAWSGVLDGHPESGNYTGTFNADTLSYAGTYTVASGKQFIDLLPCTQYWIGPHGSWEMFAIDASLSGRAIAWGSVSEAAMTLVHVLDPAIARSTGNPVVWQTLLIQGASVNIPASVSLQSGKDYIVVVVAVAGNAFQRLAFARTTFTAP